MKKKKDDDNLMRYSIQLAYLNTLRSEDMISEAEYTKIKRKLQKDYHVESDIMADYGVRNYHSGK